MKYFKHRVNTLEELRQTPKGYGVEIDLRPGADDVILHHDPFSDGPTFEEWLAEYQHNGIILNVKSEGIEKRCLELLDSHGVSNFFFLDVSMPMTIKMTQQGFHKFAVRYSVFEPIEAVLKFVGRADWIWVDSFTGFYLPQADYQQLRKHFNLCLVSPELVGFDRSQIKQYVGELNGIKIDAVCTKIPEFWMEALN